MSVIEKANILLVDDTPNNLILLEDILNSAAYHLVKATSGRKALEHLLSANFDVILLDVIMAELDGFETARRLRQRQSKQTPIIFMTALELDKEELAQGKLVGGVDYVFKPFDFDLLKSKVSGLVDLSKRTRRLVQTQNAHADATAE